MDLPALPRRALRTPRPRPAAGAPVPFALVTGATAGLGAEFARQLAAAGWPLVLVARTPSRLEAAAAAVRAAAGVPVETLAADLGTDAGVAAVADRLADPLRPVALLVNNAGHGLGGHFAGNDWEDELALLRVHTQAPLALSHAALRAMGRRGGGHVVNVASVAAFTPRGTYSAAKALVVNFSRWANAYYGPSGITTTAVCPGLVRTEFHARMGMETRGIPAPAWLDPAPVVAAALDAADRGRAVCIPTLRYKAAVAAARILPDRIVERLTRRA